ncbi:hypothetical protein [Robertmurraya siralis]|uniref:hypothetical protein n=1 Tax=Robertmurraya siralis TaxID=77777 RepID=UPI001BB34BD1|nr:hypothetical protein [Robertmurraya siralis]
MWFLFILYTTILCNGAATLVMTILADQDFVTVDLIVMPIMQINLITGFING